VISGWWWAALGAAGVGAAVLGLVDRALRAEARSVARAAAAVDRARGAIDRR
jgi:hypothetical protein